MRIVRMEAENVKRLVAVEIEPNGDVVLVSGRNAQGKSSVLDAIWMALAGGAGAKGTIKPVREGQKTAKVRLDLGELVVERRWTAAGGTTLVVQPKAEEGSLAARYASPQTVLDSLIGKLTFDPLAFANTDAKGQRETLLSVVDLPFNPEQLDGRRREVFDARTDANRDAKGLAAQLAGLATPDAETPDAELSAGAIVAEMDEAIAWNGGILQKRNAVEILQREVEDAKQQVVEAEARLLAASSALNEAATLEEIGETVDLAPIKARLTSLDETNGKVRDKLRWQSLSRQHVEAVATSDRLTAELTAIDTEKQEGLEKAKMPLDGLSFDDEGVLFGGVPFAQCSASERLRVSVAIAMALNPKIRVIRITDGSLLDSESLGMIEQLAGEHDFQVWVEVVDESGKVGVVIEDGQVVS